MYVLNRKSQILLTYPFDSIVTGLDATSDGEYFIASSLDTVYLFAIGRYLQYIAREQVKILKMMKEDNARPMMSAQTGNAEPRPGAPTEPGNTCRRCGEPVLSGRMYCNYCEIMNRRGQ